MEPANHVAIFYPVITLALWTLLILGMVGFRRVLAVSRREISSGEFKLGETSKVPTRVSIPNRNYMNLLEAPVLFYVVCVILFATSRVDSIFLALAWSFVACRLVHSLVHLSYNNVLHRLMPFALGNFILIAMWIRLALVLQSKTAA